MTSMTGDGAEAAGNERVQRGHASDLAIVIPTFRRPDLLDRLLDSIATQAASVAATIIVGDNDCDDAIRRRIERRQPALDVRYLPVPERGIAQVRNALVAEAERCVPGWLWLVMLDDDGYVPAGWLETLVACGDRFDADVVAGPVEGDLPAGAGLLARSSVFANRRRFPTGPVAMLNGAQNVAISRRLLDRIATPLFDRRYGTSGGEDYDFFRRAARSGARLVWCDEASMTEPTPVARLTPRALLYRYFSTGVTMTAIDRASDGLPAAMTTAGKGLARAVVDTAVGGVLGKPDRFASGSLALAHYSGRLCGLFGARSARYL